MAGGAGAEAPHLLQPLCVLAVSMAQEAVADAGHCIQC